LSPTKGQQTHLRQFANDVSASLKKPPFLRIDFRHIPVAFG
jgi:hypothetical protein